MTVRAWSAWSPGLESEEAWGEWARNPQPLRGEGAPPVRFVPAILRRRCDQLSRMMLHVANESIPDLRRSAPKSVFASCYGSISTMLGMLEELAVDAPLSPSRFSHSVHNTQAGLFSIWANNHQASNSIAAGDETFAHGFLEAVSLIQSKAGAEEGALFVTGDESMPAVVADRSDAPEGAYALSLVLEPSNEDCGIKLSIEAGAAGGDTSIPDALLFLRWFLSGESTLRLVHPLRTWVWTRV